MRKILSGLCAGALMAATAIAGVAPASAVPLAATPAVPQSGVIQVQGTDGYGGGLRGSYEWRQNRRDFSDDMRREWRRDRREARREWRQDRREWRRAARREWRDDRREWRRAARRGFYIDDGWGWYNGHRGYRYYRPGYREYNGFWFPLAAFAAGAVIGGALSDPGPVYRGGYSQAHYDWCYDRYRSYRASDNTYQPYDGPRRQCYSPYS